MGRRRIAIRDRAIEAGMELDLSDAHAHYLRDVLRLAPGTRIEVFDGSGRSFEGELLDDETPRIRVIDELQATAESPCRIVLYQAIAKGDRFEWALEKATELGAAEFVPLETARTVVRIKPKKVESKQERWQRVCESAARQSGRSVVPHVEPATAFATALGSSPLQTELVFDPRAEAVVTEVVDEGAAEVGIWIGPEGGFTEGELERLAERGATLVRFGPRVLRSETAGVAAVTAVQLVTGGLS